MTLAQRRIFNSPPSLLVSNPRTASWHVRKGGPAPRRAVAIERASSVRQLDLLFGSSPDDRSAGVRGAAALDVTP